VANLLIEFTGFGTTDLNGDGASFSDAYRRNSDRFPESRSNNDRLPWSTTFDLGIQHQITIAGNNKINYVLIFYCIECRKFKWI
jgi:hypothetical protein